MMKMLVMAMHGQEVEDDDQHPEEKLNQLHSEATPEQEEEAIKKLLASRQTKQHEIESYDKLRRSLQHQEEKRAKEQN